MKPVIGGISEKVSFDLLHRIRRLVKVIISLTAFLLGPEVGSLEGRVVFIEWYMLIFMFYVFSRIFGRFRDLQNGMVFQNVKFRYCYLIP